MFNKFLKILFDCKFTFLEPKNFNLVVLDDTSIDHLVYILENRRYFVLVTRSQNLKEIYITPKIIFLTFLYYRGNLFTAYNASLLKIIKPKIVLSFIDNSPRFHNLSKLFKDKINFLAIQNAARYDLEVCDYLKEKKIDFYDYKNFFIPNFFCFGQYEIDYYKRKNVKVLNFKKIGSLRTSNFRRKVDIHSIKEKYDICLVCDAAFDFDNFFKLKGFEEGFAKVVKFTIKFCKENNLKLVFPIKRYIASDKNNEIYFFKKNLDKEEFDYLINNSINKKAPDHFSSYQKLCESNVTIACCTTMLREALSLKKKIMVCNFSPTNIYDFPQEDFFLKNPSYEKFKKKLKEILSLNEKEYFDILGINKDYIIEDSSKVDANDEVNSYIDRVLKKI